MVFKWIPLYHCACVIECADRSNNEGNAKYMSIENVGPLITTIGGGFFTGVLIGYALKKVMKVVAVVVGLFFSGIAYLQYQQILSINWNKLQATSQNTLSTLVNSTAHIPGFSSSDHIPFLSNLGIPLTGSISMGIAIGFLRG